MKPDFFNLEHLEPLSNNELLEIFGGKEGDPHGIFQWIGYGIGALCASVRDYEPKTGGMHTFSYSHGGVM